MSTNILRCEQKIFISMWPCISYILYLHNRYRFYKNNLQLLIGTINLIEWLRWDLKEEMQDNDKYNQCTTEWNMCIIKVDKDCDYIPLLMAKVFLQPNRWCTACRQTCASIWRWPWKNSTNHRPHSYLFEAIVWKTSNKVLNKEINF